MTQADGSAPKQASKGCQVTTLLWSVGCAAAIILFMAGIAGPKLISARIPGNEAAAIGALKTIASSQSIFRDRERRYATLEELAAANLVDSVLGSGEKQGYRFESRPAEQPERGWWASAVPLSPGHTGDRHFVITADHTVYYSSEGPVAFDRAKASVPAGTPFVGQ